MKNLLVIFSSIITLSSCNNQGTNGNNNPNTTNDSISNKTKVIVNKPCSRKDVKEKVIALFNDYRMNLFVSQNVEYLQKGDSIFDVVSTPLDNNACNCEGTIHFKEKIGHEWADGAKNIQYKIETTDDGKTIVKLE